MSDDDFFTETFKLIDNALDYLYVADTRLTYKIPWKTKKKRQELLRKIKKQHPNQKNVVAEERNQKQMNLTKTNQRQQRHLKTKKTRTASNRELDKELRTKPDEAREEAIGAELIRRIRAGAQVRKSQYQSMLSVSDAQLSENLTAALDKGDKVRANQIAYEAFARNDPKAKTNNLFRRTARI